MPKLTEREKLADLEARQHKIGEELNIARQAVRNRYAGSLTGLPLERMAERDLKELIEQALRVGAPTALAALKTLPSLP
jgi:GGDEF domain-containing protein